MSKEAGVDLIIRQWQRALSQSCREARSGQEMRKFLANPSRDSHHQVALYSNAGDLAQRTLAVLSKLNEEEPEAHAEALRSLAQLAA